MSAAAAPAEGGAPKKGPKKMLIIIVAVVLLLVLGGGGAAVYIMKKKAAEAAAAEADGEEGGGDAHASAKDAHGAEKKHGKGEHGTPPTFVPLDPFIVNLADRETERFAQVGITLQVDDPHLGEEMKAYMPAIRNGILLILSHKSSEELLSTEGKQKLADEIRREAARAMGYDIPDAEEEEAEAKAAEAEAAASGKKKRKKKRPPPVYNPIVQVHYANFIIQ